MEAKIININKFKPSMIHLLNVLFIGVCVLAINSLPMFVLQQFLITNMIFAGLFFILASTIYFADYILMKWIFNKEILDKNRFIIRSFISGLMAVFILILGRSLQLPGVVISCFFLTLRSVCACLLIKKPIISIEFDRYVFMKVLFASLATLLLITLAFFIGFAVIMYAHMM